MKDWPDILSPVNNSIYKENRMIRLITWMMVFFMATLNTGCSTLADAQAAKGTGLSKEYNRQYDLVWNAVLDSVKATELALVSQNKQTGTILAQRSISFMSYGENVAVYIENVGRNKTRVEIINKRAMSTNIFAPDWEKRIFEQIDKRL
jgi:hypothetical protein